MRLIAFLALWLWSFASFANGPVTDRCWTEFKWGGAPQGAQFREETIQREYQPPQKMADRGFDHLVGWVTAVTQEPCQRGFLPATIEIRQYRIIERAPDGLERVVQTIDFAKGDTGILTGQLFNRLPSWYTSGISAEQPNVGRPEGGQYVIDLVPATRRIYHAWTEPRLRAKPGYRYFIEVEARISGTARLQVGIDYWKGEGSPYTGWSEGCATSTNCEAFLSDWEGNTWWRYKIFRAPKH